MKSHYVSFQNYQDWSVQSVSHDLVLSGKTFPLREGYKDRQNKKKKRGMGIDCIFVPPYDQYDKTAMLKDRKNVDSQLYDPNQPYAYQFSPMFAKYPFGRDYQNIGGDTNMYLDIFPPSYIDDHARVQYSN